MTTKRVLALAYACEPGKGSEPAAGWMWARLLGRLFDATIITRANNRPAIDAALRGIPNGERLHFVYVDLPPWLKFWKRGQRGLRLYYLLWQVLALRRARKLNKAREFDLVWHVTLANAWLGSVGSLIGPRFIYGPVGGGSRPPVRLLRALGWRGVAYEVIRTAAQLSCRILNPFARLAWRNAVLILVQNEEMRQWFPARHRSKCRQFQHTVIEAPNGAALDSQSRRKTAIYVGRVLPWKGLALALQAIAVMPGWRLLICGSGSDMRRLRAIARRKQIADRVAFLGWRPREEAFRLMREEAGVFVFPSLHDDSPFAVVEAMAAGLPVVCLDRAGPPSLAGPAGVAVDASGTPPTVATGLATALRGHRLPSSETVQARAAAFSLAARARQLKVELDTLGVITHSAGLGDSRG